MFTTIAFIVGFVLGWFINDKIDAVKDSKLNPWR